MKKLGKKITGLALGGMLLAGSITGYAFADLSTQSTQTQPKNDYYQEFVSDFATNLGVSQDQVTAALEATKKQMLQEAVQQGKITQDQVDKISSNKGFVFGMPSFKHGDRGDITQNPQYLNDAATALGMTADELKSELQSGKTMDQIVTAQGMTMDQFRQKMPQRQHKKGDITQNPQYLNNAATALGMTADELKSELQSGKTMDQIVTAQGMTMDQFRQKMPQRQHVKKDSTTSTTSNQD